MGRIKYLFTTILLLVITSCFAQDAPTPLHLELSKTIAGNYINFYVDNMDNLYLINASGQVKKINSDGDSIAVFNDVRRHGNLYSLDVTNPLKIIAYYKDFSTLLLLDRFLNIRNKLDFRSMGIVQVKAVCQSYDNNIWLFDESDSKLKKINENGKILFESSDLRLVFSESPDPSVLRDYNGLLYMYDSKFGWYIFDYYGALKTRLAFPGWKDVQVKDNYLTGRDTNGFIQYYYPGTRQLVKKNLETDNEAIIKTQQQANWLLILNSKNLAVYNME